MTSSASSDHGAQRKIEKKKISSMLNDIFVRNIKAYGYSGIMHSLQSHADMMIKLLFLTVLFSASAIFAHPSKVKRSLFDSWSGPPSGPSYGSGAPWSSNPWSRLKTTPDLYPSPSRWSISKPPPLVVTKEIRVPVEKFVPVEVAKYIPYPVEKIIQVPVDRIVEVPVDRIVRVPVEVPAAPAPAPQIVTLAQAPAVQAAAPLVMQAPVAMPMQQQMPLMLRPGTQFPIVITAQGLSISTSGLVGGGMDQMPVQSAPVAPPPMAPPIAQTVIPPAPVSNNSTVGISLILNGLSPQRPSQGIRQGLTYVNVLPDVPNEPIHGNNFVQEVPLNDNIFELIRNGGGVRWRRNTNVDINY